MRGAPTPSAPGRLRPTRLLVALICLCPVLLCGDAHGYAEQIHAFISRRALSGSGLNRRIAPISAASPAAVRAAIDAFAREAKDPALRVEWLRRYPTPAAFDAWAEKEWLLLSPSTQVFGIDRFGDLGQTLADVVTRGSREPDDDWRNRERIGYDARRQPLLDARGNKVPADPALLNMGNLGMLSSQAHAHYGLAQVQFSDDPKVLKSDPRRFAVAAGYNKGPILTLAAEMAQEHLDLSLLAALLDAGGGAEELAWLYTGQAFHYLEDVSNQIHTVQVGLYDFFFDAFLARLKMSARSGGGYFGDLRSLSSIGIDILTSHHVLSENLTRKRVLGALNGQGTPEAVQLLKAPGEDDPVFAAHLDAALAQLGANPERGEFGLAITRAMIEDSSYEGADVYRAIRAIAAHRLRHQGVLFDEAHEDPDSALVPPGQRDAAAYQRFFDLQEHAFRRAGTALRRWVGLEQRALAGARTPQQRAELRAVVLQRLVRRQLALLGQAEARRADYLANPPEAAHGKDHMPAMLAGEVGLLGIVGLGLGLLWRRRRRAAEARTSG